MKMYSYCSNSGVPNLGDASPWGDVRGFKSVISWVYLYQRGNAIEVRGDAEAKRLETPAQMLSVISDFSIFIILSIPIIVLTKIGYMIGIRQEIGFVFSLELTPVFNNSWNVKLITNIGCYCLWHYHWHY
jgi:hypothetical protein